MHTSSQHCICHLLIAIASIQVVVEGGAVGGGVAATGGEAVALAVVPAAPQTADLLATHRPQDLHQPETSSNNSSSSSRNSRGVAEGARRPRNAGRGPYAVAEAVVVGPAVAVTPQLALLAGVKQHRLRGRQLGRRAQRQGPLQACQNLENERGSCIKCCFVQASDITRSSRY